MKIFNLRRLLGMAAIYGAVRYVRSHGGPNAVIDDLRSKAREFADKQRGSGSAGVADDLAMQDQSSAGNRSYASYDLDTDDKLRH